MKKPILITLLSFLASCASVEENEQIAKFKESHKRSWDTAQLQRKNENYSKYLNDVFLPINNKYKLDERGDCYSLSKAKVEMILYISGEGVIERVSGWPANRKLACFQKSYTGIKLPAPPLSPLLLNLSMG